MTTRRAVFLTTRRELLERLRSRAFRISTALVLALAAERSKRFGIEVETVSRPDAESALAAVRDGEAELAIVGGRLVSGADPDQPALAVVQEAARPLTLRERLGAEGLSAAEAERLLQVALLDVSRLSGEGGGEGEGLAAFASIVLYLAIFTGGLQVATGVVEEKGSRVVELILSTIRPAQLLLGKVLGIGLTAFLQLALVLALWLILALATGEVELPQSAAETTALVVAYFLLGYAFYACAFAAAAALVSRQEDVQSTTAPLMIALVGSYIVSLGVIDDPDSVLARVCSVLPPVAPLVVPVRAAQGALPAVELIASLAAMALGTLALVALGARVYERSVLLTGAPLKLSQALRLARPGRESPARNLS